jgi:hypothetical protein
MAVVLVVNTRYARFVAIGTRIAVIVAALVTIVPLAACGGGGDQMRVTLTDQACSYRGDKIAAAGRFTIEVENQSTFGASFALKKLAKGFTAANIAPILATEGAWVRSLSTAELRNVAHGKLPRHPRPDLPQIFTEPEDSVVTEIGGGASSVLPADLPAGSYVLLCRIPDLRAPSHVPLYEEQYVASQIEVTGTPSYSA